MNDVIILLAKTNPKKGNTNAQAPKQDILGATKAPNQDKGGTRDATASSTVKLRKRARSQHSIASRAKRVAASITKHT